MKTVSEVLKRSFCFTVVVLFFCSAAYCGSLKNKGTQIDSSMKKKSQEQTLETQMAKLFKSSKIAKKLFVVDQYKFGIIFNPKRKSLNFGGFIMSNHVIFVTEQDLPEELLERIASNIPEGYTCSTFMTPKVNGKKALKFFGF